MPSFFHHHTLFLKISSLFVLLLVVVVWFVVSGLHSARSQVTQHCQWWPVVSYMWNQGFDAWARTSPTLQVGGFSNTVAGGTPPECDSSNPIESGNPSRGFLQYYHDSDPDCPYTSSRCRGSAVTIGKMRGSAWSPIYGVMHFSESQFPRNETCYGLSGSNRQPRIISILDRGTERYTITGCVYIPFLKDWILLSNRKQDGSVLSDTRIPDNWGGVEVQAQTARNLVRQGATLARTPYLNLFNCGWSSKHGYWSFGPNQSSTKGCLPSTHSYASGGNNRGGDSYIRFFENTQSSIILNPLRNSARVGQTISYNVQCPQGYKKATLLITEGSSNTPTEKVHDLYDLTYEQVFSSNITDIKVRCEDQAGVFSGQKQSSSVAGVFVDVIFVPLFSITPEVIAEGGFISINGTVSNWGDLNNNATCTIYDRTPGKNGEVVKEFRAASLNNNVEGEWVVVRDAVYELTCRYLNDDAIVQLRDGTVTDPTEFSDRYWETTSPVQSIVKVFPSRIDERNVITNDVCVPTLTKNSAGDQVTVSLPSESTCTAEASDVQEIRVYALTSDSDYALVNETSIVEKVAYTKGSSVSGACSSSRSTEEKKKLVGDKYPDIFSETADNNKKKVTVIDNCRTNRIPNIVIQQSDIERSDNGISNKVFVAEVITNDGRRSEKAVMQISSR